MSWKFAMEHLSQSWSHVADDGVVSSALASLGTGVGALPVMVISQLSDRWKMVLLSVGSGVMLSAAAFSLLLPAFDLMGSGVSGWDKGMALLVSMVLGAAVLYGLETLLPEVSVDEHSQGRSIWLFVLAIALHHFPEGLAVGLGVATTHDATVAVGIALQNLPEGLMVALALRQLGYGSASAIILATMSGWLEPVGGLVGVMLADVGSMIAPLGMALAAGAMVFVVLHEILPDLKPTAVNGQAPAGVLTGVLMMGMVQQFLG